MTLDISCPRCGESDAIHGDRSGSVILLTCGSCGETWERDTSPRCKKCGRVDVQPVPLAIVEKGRGTQLSVVGTRTVHLCPGCDGETLARYHRNRPNPLMPDELPTASEDRPRTT